jgi:predicted acetyltransferase
MSRLADEGVIPVGMAGLSIKAAAPGERDLLENLTQFYLHDFSELFSETSRLDLMADGRFSPDPPLDRWWQAEDHLPFLLRWQDRPVGFALINRHSHMGAPMDYAVAEFFVVRKCRRVGIGSAAAGAIFSALPGQWEAAVMRRNRRALAFWDAAIRQHGKAQSIVAHDRDDADWNGLVYRFVVGP